MVDGVPALDELESQIETLDIQRARVVAMRGDACGSDWSIGTVLDGDGAGPAVRGVYSERLAVLDAELAALHAARLDLVLRELAAVERDVVAF